MQVTNAETHRENGITERANGIIKWQYKLAVELYSPEDEAENEQLGKELSEGKIQQLNATIALHKDYAKDLRKSLTESHEWVEMLDEELEAAQSTIAQLRKELTDAKASKPDGDAPAAAEAPADAEAPAAADADMAEAPAAAE